MRRTIRPVIIVFAALLGTVGMAIASAFTAALSFGAIGLFVPGTGTPDASKVTDYLTNARDRYTQGTPCSNDTNCKPVGINYPASFFPLVIFPGWCRSGPNGCDKWNDSVGMGTATLTAALKPYLDPNSPEEVTIFGYSQGGAVVSNVLNNLHGLDPSVAKRLHVVTIGGIENPDGGLWSRLGFLPTIPFLDITFGPPMATNTGIDTTAIGFEYDPVTYAPRYWGNALALLNAAAALETVHGDYLSPDGTPLAGALPYGYTPGTLADQLNCATHKSNCRYGQTVGTKNTYIMIPATSLPIFDLVMGAVPGPLKPLAQPVVNFLTPVTKLLIDLGYDWSGDPDKPTPLSILPFNPAKFNPVDFSVKFAEAVAQGIHDAVNGGPTATLAPSTTTTSTALTSPAAQATEKVSATTGSSNVTEPDSADKADVDTTGADTVQKVADDKKAAAAAKVAAKKAAAEKRAADKKAAAAAKAAAKKAAAEKKAEDKKAAAEKKAASEPIKSDAGESDGNDATENKAAA